MTDKDILFKDLTNEELVAKPQDEIAHFGWGGNGAFAFFLTAEAYFESAETLYSKMRSAGKDFAVLDGHIYPLVFLYRHFVELFLKGLYFKYSRVEEEDLKKYLNEVGHDLRKSWAKVKPFLSQGKKHVGSKENIGAIEHYIHAMNDFDADSMGMRYPVNKNLDKMHTHPVHLDYINLHDRMVEFYHAIHQIDYDVDNQVLSVASDDEISYYMDHYSRLLPILEKYIESLKKEILEKADKKKPALSMHERIMNQIRENKEKALCRQNGEEVEDDHGWIYENSGDDFKILVESLYHSGRSVQERLINLSSNPAERSKEFVSCCLDLMKAEGMAFGKPVKTYQTNVFSKSADSIFENISKAISLLPPK